MRIRNTGFLLKYAWRKIDMIPEPEMAEPTGRKIKLPLGCLIFYYFLSVRECFIAMYVIH